MSASSAALAVDNPRNVNGNGRRRAERLAVEERRAQLLKYGVQIVGTRRYEEPWLEEVARTADISKGLIYHYFDTKRGFYVEILRHIAQGLAQTWADTVTPLIEQGAKAQDVTKAGLQSYMDYAQQYPAAFRTLSEAGAGIDPEVKKVDGYLHDELIRYIANYRGVKDLSPVVISGVTAWAAFAQQMTMDWMDDKSLDREEIVSMMLKVMSAIFLVD